jgi:hypothetical protein
MKRRLRLKIIRIREQSISASASTIRAHCPVCRREVETLNPAQAAEVLAVEAHAFSRLIAAGGVHQIETVSGNRRICRDSLFPNRS